MNPLVACIVSCYNPFSRLQKGAYFKSENRNYEFSQKIQPRMGIIVCLYLCTMVCLSGTSCNRGLSPDPVFSGPVYSFHRAFYCSVLIMVCVHSCRDNLFLFYRQSRILQVDDLFVYRYDDLPDHLYFLSQRPAFETGNIRQRQSVCGSCKNAV